MAQLLEISALGSLELYLDGVPVSGLASRKAEALLVYLACTARPQARMVLAELLWDDRSEAQASANLRVLLSSLRQSLGGHLQITRQSVALAQESPFWLDVVELEQGLTRARQLQAKEGSLTQAVAMQLEHVLALYRGHFLEGFYLRESRGFEEWMVMQRERLQRLVIEALHDLVTYYLQEGEYHLGIERAARLLHLDPFREEAHRQMMVLLAHNGQRSAALAQFESCRTLLAEELDIEPSNETLRVYEWLLEMPPVAQPTLKPLPPPSSAPPYQMPSPLTSFVGREIEVAQVAKLLAEPACRLLTLVGHGGIGKTRLAIQTAAQRKGYYRHGIYFVPLAPVSSPDFLISTLAAALHFSFHAPQDPKEQLFAYLYDKQILLVLDNFDHLLEAAPLVVELLQAAPHITLLVTSRESLNLQAEWIFQVYGLPFPNETREEPIEEFSAVQLFCERARQVRPGFTLSAESRPWVSRICRLVDGIPLGIELAATWVRLYGCAQIAERIQQNLDFLATTRRDVPERHRSLRALFEHSRSLLTEEGRALFRQLAVFSGEFSLEAAEKVTGAAPPHLLALVDQSLLRECGVGRYEMHGVLKQYALEQLERVPAEKAHIRDAYCRYYSAFLQRHHGDLTSWKQGEALREIEREIENIRAAWQWAVEQSIVEALEQALDSLYLYYESRSLFEEGKELFSRAAAQLDGDPLPEAQALLLGKLRARQGVFARPLGLYAESQAALEESLTLLRALAAWSEVAFALNNLGILAINLGEYNRARELLQEGYRLYRQSGNRRGLAFCLNNLGFVAIARGENAEGKQLLRRGLALFKESGDFQGAASALANLGEVAHSLGKFEEARQLYEESLEVQQGMGNRMGVLYALIGLGNVASALRKSQEARRHFQNAIHIAREIQAPPRLMDALVGLATVLAQEGERARAVELLAHILHHPTTDRWAKERAQQLLAHYAADLPPPTVATAQARGRATPLDRIVASLLND